MSTTVASHDPRLGCASASTMLRTKNCPSWLARQRWARARMIPLETEESPFARFGTAVHEQLAWCLATKKSSSLRPSIPPGLEDGVIECVDSITHGVGRVSWLAGVTPAYLMTTEVRLWSSVAGRYDDDHADTLRTWAFSGQYDVAFVNEASNPSHAVIIDAKTGWRGVAPADRNLQMRTLAVLAAENFQVERVTVAIVQPTYGQPTACEYNEHDLATAKAEIESIIKKAETATETSDLNPSGSSCRYCPVRMYCPAARAVFMKVATGNLPDEHHVRLEYAEVAELVIKDIRSQAEAVLRTNPKAVPGWKIDKDSSVRSIPKGIDPIIEHSKKVLTESEIKAMAKVGVGDLEQAVQKAFAASMGLSKREALSAARIAIEPLVNVSVRTGGLVRDDDPEVIDPTLTLHTPEPPF